jgi:peptidoglycan/xylan/chitin deacetylase (PgdA/CDA1 family)
MRVGFWRFHALFERLGIRPTLSVNGSVIGACPRVAAGARDAGWEFMGHGWFQVPTQRLEDQRAMIAGTTRAIADFTGRPCTGWLGPGLTETLETPDILAEHGVRWTGDFVLAMPYSVELNDIPVVMIQHHNEQELPRRARLTAARLLQEAEASSGCKVMGIAIHPYITGVPHRIAALEALYGELAADPRIAFLQGDEIAAWYLASGDAA